MKYISGIFALVIFAAGCKKNELGGKSTIKGTVAHHATAIPYASVFVKFNSREFPGSDTSVYDTKLKADASGKFELNVYKGNYYLYSVGLDNSSANPQVKGGVPVKVRHKETVDLTVPVSDQH